MHSSQCSKLMSFLDRYDIHDVPSYTIDKLLLHEDKMH